MTRSKKIFLGGAVVFFIGIAFASYDISRRTTFPGSKPQLQERIKKQYNLSDSLVTDTVKTSK
ncbi:hypothetical protein SanaruYs_33290 [Chryseotalea sanaruensis]|jgi:hypothetical protein|uniref:Uncharacterized protein n=1 Tax=Chryseotalea sanaruensis TaxID=2482724 RepID=A0A401UDV3_9BACT|nr:hypothetical protein [Chryseotalea sanaruensis]GCC53088.1 hypothetical protein SanaruYs_33290 [Chryseotalea sanaruensis]